MSNFVPRASEADRPPTSVRPSVGDSNVRFSQATRSFASQVSIALAPASARSVACVSELSRATTAANDEIDWNWVTISENAPNR